MLLLHEFTSYTCSFGGDNIQKAGEKKIIWVRSYQSSDTHKGYLHRTRQYFFHKTKRSFVKEILVW